MGGPSATQVAPLTDRKCAEELEKTDKCGPQGGLFTYSKPKYGANGEVTTAGRCACCDAGEDGANLTPLLGTNVYRFEEYVGKAA